LTDQNDPITVVLRECEERLRTLAAQGRLTHGALAAFVELSLRVQFETDRRKGGERRASDRSGTDRRVAEVIALAVSVL
jgi:hypothetical protein